MSCLTLPLTVVLFTFGRALARPTVRLAVAIVAVVLTHVASAFYLPGVAPHEYSDGETLDLKVNKLTSPNSALSYEFYDLAFCRPPEIRPAAENLGEHLTGDSIENTAYSLQMNRNATCQVLCTKELSYKEVLQFQSFIRTEYMVNWILDNLPAAAVGITTNQEVLYSTGFPIGGRSVSGELYLYNHIRMVVKYHQSTEYEGKRVVGFDVHPMTVQHTIENGAIKDCNAETGIYPGLELPRMHLVPVEGDKTVVTWSYDVFYESSDVRWASRWDIYLSMGDRFSSSIHWFSILNSVLIVVFLTGLVAMIMVRALRRDFTRYNRVATDEEKAEDKEETGWKLVHADVFRPPTKNPMLFAVLIGTGAQVVGMTVVTILFAAAGFLSPANRGSLMIAMLLVFLLMGAGAGYVAARIHKMMSGLSYQRCTIGVALGLPSIIFVVVFVLNLFVWHAGSANAIPFGSMFGVVVLWLVCSVPLVFVGAFNGFKKDKIELPVAIGSIPRPIPPQGFFYSTPIVMAAGGILPFGAVFVELFFILSSLWLDQYYYVFGFLLLVLALLAVTCAEISIVLVYFQLCAEDHRWWWRSVLASGSAGIYLFIYSIYYYLTRLHMADQTSVLLYFGYMTLVSLLFFLLTGTIGHLSTFAFVKKIYGSIKVD